jgi:hypothetical protein
MVKTLAPTEKTSLEKLFLIDYYCQVGSSDIPSCILIKENVLYLS